MLNLAAPTPDSWLPRALAELDVVLLDHAHCEKKAASTAMNLIFRYGDVLPLMKPLSELAREELEHFERCLDLLAARGIEFRRLEPSRYAANLLTQVRKAEPHRMLDTLLVCSLIESRSCDRMKLLAEAVPDKELAAFYTELLASEARHHHTYVDLALQLYPREEVWPRLKELAAFEATVQVDDAVQVRMHA